MKHLKIMVCAFGLIFLLYTFCFAWGRWKFLGSPNQGRNWGGGNKVVAYAKVIAHNDGRLDLFAMETPTGNLWHKRQRSPGRWMWSTWAPLGQPGEFEVDQYRDFAVGSNQDGRIEVYVKTADHGIWHKYEKAENDNWSGWESLGAPAETVLPYDIVASADSANRLWLWSTGADGRVWFRHQVRPNAEWLDWANLEKPFHSQALIDKPAVEKNADGMFEILSVGRHGRLFLAQPSRPSLRLAAWNPMSAQDDMVFDWGDSPAICANQDGRLEVFAVGSSKLWHIWQDSPSGEWIPNWVPLPDPPTPASQVLFGPAAVANADGRIELFISDAYGHVYHLWQIAPNSDWSRWEPINNVSWRYFSFLTAGRNADGQIEIFVRDNSGNIWFAKQ